MPSENNIMQRIKIEDSSSQTSLIYGKSEEVGTDMEYFNRNQPITAKKSQKQNKQKQKAVIENSSNSPFQDLLQKLSESSLTEKESNKIITTETVPNSKLCFTKKNKQLNFSPFQQTYAIKSEVIEELQPLQCKVTQKKHTKRIYEQEFFFLHFNRALLNSLRKKYTQIKEKQKKYGTDSNIAPFKLELAWKKINIAGTTNISVFRQFILSSQWIDSLNSQVKIWASRTSSHQFECCLQEELKKSNPSLDKYKFIPLHQLNSWYTISHLQSKFSKLFFLIQVKQDQILLENFPTNCLKCKSDTKKLCLCLKPLFCSKCSTSNEARLHNIHCQYSVHFLLACQAMELKPFSKLGLIGLKNPNNICFLNTALQCLLAVEPLTKYFLSRQYFRDLNPSNYLGSFGQITCRYAEFISQAWCQSLAVYDPKQLRNSLGRFYNSFVDQLNQQDSHECMSLILNYLRQDLNSAPPLKPYQEQALAIKEVADQEAAAEAWQKSSARNNSIVDELFTILIKSKIQCEKCSFSSTTFQTALDLPLPVIPPQKKKVERKTINCCFIYQNSSQKNVLLTLAVDNQTLQEIQNRIRTILGVKIHRKLCFYMLSTHGRIQRLTWKTNLSQALAKIQPQQKQFFCLQYPEEELSSQFFEITLIFQYPNKKQGIYENISFKRPLFFSKIARPKEGRQIVKRILLYLYPRIYRNSTSVSKQTYLNTFLNGPAPFRLFLATQFTNQQFIELSSEDSLKLSVNYTQIIARFQEYSPFQIQDLSLTKKIDSTQQNVGKPGLKKQMIVTEEANITDCIKKFAEPELINGWKCPKCQSCQNKAFRTLSIYETSKIIIFYFKRFSTQNIKLRGSQIHKKIEDPIKFPLILKIDSFIQRSKKEEKQLKKERQYRLKAVANHYQSKFNSNSYGHYTAFVQNKHGWFACNDELIKEMNSGDVCTPNAYYLIYEQIE